MDTKPKQPVKKSMNVRHGRKSTLSIPVDPSVKVITIPIKTVYIKGQPVLTYVLPEGGTIAHEPQKSRSV